MFDLNFLKSCENVNFQEGEDIYLDEQIGKNIYYVKTGLVSLYKLKADIYIELDIASTGDFFGFLPFLNSENRRFLNARALKNTYILDVTKLFLENYNDSSPFIKMVLNNIAKKLKKSYIEQKKLQFFENINYEESKNTLIKAHHLKDLNRITTIMLLLSKVGLFSYEELQNSLLLLLNRITIKVDEVLELFEKFNIVKVIKDSSENVTIEVTDVSLLNELNKYLTKNYVKDYKRLILNENQFILLNSIKNHLEKLFNDKIFDLKLSAKELFVMQKNFFDETFEFTKESLKLEVDFQNMSFKSLNEKGIIQVKPGSQFSGEYRVTIKDIFNIQKYQEIIRFLKRY